MENYKDNGEFPPKKWYKKWWGIILIFLLTMALLVVVIFALMVLNFKKGASLPGSPMAVIQSENKEISPETKVLIEDYDDPWMGTSTPLITIVEFGDYSCSRCRESFTVIREIGYRYKDRVKIIFRDFPVVSAYSQDLAMAARCAQEQNKYWEMYDKLFINQGVSTKEQLLPLAQQIGLNIEKFENCYDNKKYQAKIEKDSQDALKLEISGTPTWFIDGNKVAGSIPKDTFIKIIDKLLETKNSAPRETASTTNN